MNVHTLGNSGSIKPSSSFLGKEELLSSVSLLSLKLWPERYSLESWKEHQYVNLKTEENYLLCVILVLNLCRWHGTCFPGLFPSYLLWFHFSFRYQSWQKKNGIKMWSWFGNVFRGIFWLWFLGLKLVRYEWNVSFHNWVRFSLYSSWVVFFSILYWGGNIFLSTSFVSAVLNLGCEIVPAFYFLCNFYCLF